MRAADEHLTPQELESLLFAATDPKVPIAAGEAALSAKQHLDGCAACQQMAKKYVNADAALESLRTWSKCSSDLAPSTPDCPADDIWLRIAAGLADDTAASQYLPHAAQCDRCGRLLQESMEDLAQDVSEEERAAVAQLPSAGESWQTELAKKLGGERSSDSVLTAATSKQAASRRFTWWPRFAVAAALGLAVFAGWLVSKKFNPDPNQLLAEAYTEQRTLELRIPIAEYGPMRVQRGTAISRMNRPTALLDAEALISHKLTAEPENPVFLEMRGRAELLDWKYEAAIESLKHGLDLDPNSLSMKTDLASAYFERAEAENRAVDYGSAIELLGQVLSKAPDEPVALFNHAIACERMFMYHDAIQDWEHYLRVDRGGKWTQEARQRLDELRRKLSEHHRQEIEALYNVEQFSANVDLNDEKTWSPVESRIEDYLQLASTDWLPRFYSDSEKASAERVPVGLALIKLATVLKRRHTDGWLLKIIQTRPSPSVSLAVGNLADALRRNSTGDAEGARLKAEAAMAGFRKVHQTAGYARASLERVYALHRVSAGRSCRQAISDLRRDVDFQGFSWMEIQLSLEESVCAEMTSDPGFSENILTKALNLSAKFRYPSLHLRALVFLATAKRAINADLPEAWSSDREGLANFWVGNFGALRAYSIYQDLSFAAETSDQNQLLYYLRREAVALDEDMHDPTRHALAHSLLAHSAAITGRSAEAESEYKTAGALFQTLEKTNANNIYSSFNRLELAKVQAHLGRTAEAIHLLDTTQPQVLSFENNFIRAEFLNVRGEIYELARRFEEAEQEFLAGLKLTSSDFSSLRTQSEREEWQRTRDKSYRGLASVRLALHRTSDALDIWEERLISDPATGKWTSGELQKSRGDQRYGSSAARSSLTRTYLPSLTHETVISYAILPSEIAIWAFDDRGITSVVIPENKEELERTIRRFNELCGVPGSDIVRLRQTGRKLYELLVAPIQYSLSSERTLVVEPDGVLNQLPFQALVDDRNEYLGQSYAIVYSPGLQEYLKLDQGALVSRSSLALVVSPTLGPDEVSEGLIPDRDSAREALAVEQLFLNHKLVLGPVTWAAVEKNLPGAEVFHFAGHAVSASERSTLVFPRLAGSAPTNTQKFASRTTKSLRLVFLSACSTGKTDVFAPAGMISEFLSEGVPSVIATRWDIDSAASTDFVRAFYSHVLENVGVGEALRRADQHALQQRETEHPYFWAAFTAFGRGN